MEDTVNPDMCRFNVFKRMRTINNYLVVKKMSGGINTIVFVDREFDFRSRRILPWPLTAAEMRESLAAGFCIPINDIDINVDFLGDGYSLVVYGQPLSSEPTLAPSRLY